MTRQKLQPFYPPLEPLQSLNLRAALFRCLEQAKKIGVLGRDAVLRKTMLDECKGEKLEEVLAVFSNAVLKRKLQEQAPHPDSIAEQLALENLSYSGERTVISSLILAYKASLRKHLHHKNDLRASYGDFSDLLALNERKLARRRELVEELIQDDEEDVGPKYWNQVEGLHERLKKNWTGSDEWLEFLLYSDSRAQKEGFLGTLFETVWEHFESERYSDIEGNRASLSQQLDARIRTQEERLARWQEFGKTLAKPGATSPTKQQKEASPPSKIIDLAFSRHLGLQIGLPPSPEKTVRSTWIPLEDYTRIVENMTNELADVGKPQKKSSRLRQSFSPQSSPVSAKDAPPVDDGEWSSFKDTEEPSPDLNNQFTKSTPQTPPPESPEISRATTHEILEPTLEPTTHQLPSPTKETNTLYFMTNSITGEARVGPKDVFGRIRDQSAQPQPRPKTPVIDPPVQSAESELDLADQILNSVSASSPSPKKTRHTLSLAERTRLSMSRASHSKYSDLHDDVDNLADLTRLSIRTKPFQPARVPVEPEEEKHADLIERTRKSMVGFEAAQKKAQIERRRSIKDAKKKQRESSYFPKVEEEPVTPNIDPVELIDGDPDYESVFKSRPKIKTSPLVSPTRIIMEDESED
jgi:hypothetical protein